MKQTATTQATDGLEILRVFQSIAERFFYEWSQPHFPNLVDVRLGDERRLSASRKRGNDACEVARP